MTSTNRPLLFVLALILLCGSSAVCQQAVRPERGTMPNRTYSLSDIENISLENGNVHLSIPLASLPPIAGSKLSWTISANYNSKLWNAVREQADYSDDVLWRPYVVDSLSLDSGWRIGGQYFMEFRNSNVDFSRLFYPQTSGLPQNELNLLNNFGYWKMVLHMPDGAEHEFRPVDFSPYSGNQDFLRGYFNVIPSGTAMRYYSVDGTYMFARVTNQSDWTVYLSDGTQIIQTPDGIQRVKDTNGNKIKIFSDTIGIHYQDEQTNREIRITYDPSANSGHGQTRVWYSTVGGTEHHVDVNYGSTVVQGKSFLVTDWDPNGGTTCQRAEELFIELSVVRDIVFPQTEPTQPQQHFAFSYNSDTTENTSTSWGGSCVGGILYNGPVALGWGELSRMVTPSGSIVDYSYSKDAVHTLSTIDDLATETITQKKVTHDGTTDTWSFSIQQFGGSMTSPDGSTVTEDRHCPSSWTSGCVVGKAGLAYRTSRPFITTERHWANLTFSGASTASPGGIITLNPFVDFEYTTLLDANNNKLKMSAKAFQYDYNGNVTQTTEYDWFDPGLVSRDAQGVPTGVPGSATVLRVTNNSYYNQASTSSSGNVYAKRSVSTGAPLILNAAQQTTSGPAIAQFSYDGQLYNVAPTAGNLTTKKVWDDLDTKWITTSSTYDLYGNVATATDGRGKVTQFFYEDATHALPTRVVMDPENGTGTQTASTAYDFSTGLVTSQTDVNGQIINIDYTNQLLQSIDPFGRPGITKAPAIDINGTNHRRRVTTTYLDSARQTIVATDLNAENDKVLKTRTTSDMLGRPILSESTEDGTNYTISVRSAYLNMGQVTLTSSPMRSAAATTDSWTRSTRDSAGRVKEVATFGGATQPAWIGTAGAFTGRVTTEYNANFTTVTDQAGKVRRSLVDALGRLVRVDEPDETGNLGTTILPAQKTEYEYDIFNNLKKVTQGVQQRNFTYDSLSRLRTAINPESGTVTYQYDDNGNLKVKTDARTDPNNSNKKVSAHFEYDSLNRITRRWYNGSSSLTDTTHNSPSLPPGVGTTDEAKFYYDSQTLPGGAPVYNRGSAVGRLVAQTYGSGTNGDYYAYDVLGRQNLKIQQIGAVNYSISAGYTLSGAMSSLTYPSLHTIGNTFDQAGRLTVFNGNLGVGGSPLTYSTGAVYSALGNLSKEQFGTNTAVYHKLHYNSRAQLCDVRASSVNDEWSGELGAIANYYSTPFTQCGNGSDNNGNLLMSQTIVNSSVYFEDRYSYDSLNRLTAVNEYQNGTTYSGKQEYSYDPWGNRTLKPASTLGTYKEFTVNTANNQLGVPAGQPLTIIMSYDDAGNLINDTYTGAGNRTYDAENKITSAWGGNNQAQLYGYDASGQRIKRTVDGVTTWQVYGFGGELLAEYAANGAANTPQKEYGYRNGELLVTGEPASAQQSTQNVSWTNTAGVSVSGNNLTKNTADAWGNSGASSNQAIASGDGYVELTAGENTSWRMIGLSNGDSNKDYTDIDFAAYLGANSLCIYEAGAPRGCVSTYVPGDVIRVAVESGVVKYKKNGAVVYTSSVTPGYPLLVDTALWSNGATLNSVVISGLITGGAPQNTQNVNWANTTGVSIAGNNLTKNTADAWGNSGASSSQSITSGDGYVELTPSENTSWRMIGLSNGDSNQDYTDIDFAAYLGANSLCIYEAGASRGCVSTYVPGDVIRVAVESGVVKYKKNGAVVYTSSVTPSYPLLVDTALWSNGATLSGVVISGNLSGGGGGSGSSVHWLVSDHLGTPRMIIDQTGTAVKRHDYLPFGEELFALAGGRTTAQGYVTGDGIRQQFTSKERDIETGLDYSEARYYSSVQGRFTSVDPTLMSAKSAQPQSWNRYSYCINNPLKWIDPSGLSWFFEDHEENGHKVRSFYWYENDKDAPRNLTIYTEPLFYGGPDSLGGERIWLGPAGEYSKLTEDQYDEAALRYAETGDVGFMKWWQAGLLGALMFPNTGAHDSEGIPEEEEEPILFAQKTASERFQEPQPGEPPSAVAGQTIGEVTAGLRSGNLNPSQLPLDVVNRNGQLLTLNTRSLLALRRAGISPSQYVLRDLTGNAQAEEALTERLLHNNMTTGSSVLRVTGAGSNASSIK